MDTFNQIWNIDGLQDELNHEEECLASYRSRDALVFLIDAQVDNTAGVCQACSNLIQESIIANAKNNMFGCIRVNGDNVEVIKQLGIPSIELVYLIESIANRRLLVLDNQYLNLNEALWLCLRMLGSLDNQKYSRRVILFTDRDDPYPLLDRNDPCSLEKIKRRQVLQRSKDLFDAGIKIEVIPCSREAKIRFNFHRFYQHIMYKSDDELEVFVEDVSLESLNERVRSRLHPLRASIANGQFIIGCDVSKSRPDCIPRFSLYRFAQVTNLPARIRMDRRTGEEVVSVTSKRIVIDDSMTSDPIAPSDMEYEVDVLGAKAVFSQDEFHSMFSGMIGKVQLEISYHMLTE